MKKTSNNTKEKRLRREFKISPREARHILKNSGYNYQLAETTLIQQGFTRLTYSMDDICRAIKLFTDITAKFVNAFGEACSAFAKTFSEKLSED